MVKRWTVLFERNKPGLVDDLVVEFVDIREILEGIPVFKRLLFEKIAESIKKYDNYYPWKNIKDVTPPEHVPFELSNYFVLLGVDNNNLKFGLFMILLGDQVILGGIWPEELVEAVRENKDILEGVLYAFIEKPDNWREVFLVYAI